MHTVKGFATDLFFGFGFEFLNMNVTSKTVYRRIKYTDVTFSPSTALVLEIYISMVLDELAISPQIGVFQPNVKVLTILDGRENIE